MPRNISLHLTNSQNENFSLVFLSTILVSHKKIQKFANGKTEQHLNQRLHNAMLHALVHQQNEIISD